METYCRCCATPLNVPGLEGTGDHCPECGCEEYEESCARGRHYNPETGEKES